MADNMIIGDQNDCGGTEPEPKEDQEAIIDFAVWYSGMERQKVINAYKRYTSEVLTRTPIGK